MNLTGGIHTCYSVGDKVWAAEAESRHMGGITIVWREEAGSQVEGASSFGTNVLSLTITEVRKHWYIFGAYITS